MTRNRQSAIIVAIAVALVGLPIGYIMLATYLSEPGPSLRPPEEMAGPTLADNPIAIRLGPEGEILLDGEAIELDHLVSSIEALQAETPERPVLILARGEDPHGRIVEIWDELNRKGIRVSLQRAHPD